MSSVALPPSSESISSDVTRLEHEKRTRPGRIDYKALHSGRAASISAQGDASSQTKGRQKLTPVKASLSASALHEQTTRQSHKPNTTASSSSSPNAAQRSSQVVRRSAERERKLRSDPNAQVNGPTDVTCKRCGTDIKLSTKSTYDPFHWQRHIERCIRRNAKSSTPTNSMNSAKPQRRRRSFPIRGERVYDTRTHGGQSHSTPSLTPDTNDDIHSTPVKDDTPMVEDLPVHDDASVFPMPELTVGLDRCAFDDYRIRSKRSPIGDGPAALYPVSFDGHGSWSWSQVKEAVWN